MGDRGNVCIREQTENVDADVYLYTHWRGSDLPEIVRQALAKQWRWDDAPYLARIILNEMQGEDRRETGFGISTTIGDNENPIIVVDVQAKTVAIVPAPRHLAGKISASYDAKRIPFAEYVKAPKDT